MIITVGQLKLIHYYYFAMGIFSVTNAFFVGFGSLFSILFMAFYGVNLVISMYIATVARRRMRDYIIIQSLGFFLKHVLITVATVGVTTLIWVSNVFQDVGLLSTMIFVNYLFLFLAGMWYILARTEFTHDLFQFYDTRIFRKSKKFMISIRRMNRTYYDRQLVTERDIDTYKFGSIKVVDENILDAWKNKEQGKFVMECMGRIELSIARFNLEDLQEKVSNLGLRTRDPLLIKELEKYEKRLKEKRKEIMLYEKEFFRKTGEVSPE